MNDFSKVRFKGTFRDGKRNGPAIEEDKDGTRFEGTYVDDRREGKFVIKDKNGRLKESGVYERGRKIIE